MSAVVLDPYTGAVYAEATYPSYANERLPGHRGRGASRFIDPVVNLRAGSVFKMMTA